MQTIQTTTENISVWELSDHSATSLFACVHLRNTPTYLLTYLLKFWVTFTWITRTDKLTRSCFYFRPFSFDDMLSVCRPIDNMSLSYADVVSELVIDFAFNNVLFKIFGALSNDTYRNICGYFGIRSIEEQGCICRGVRGFDPPARGSWPPEKVLQNPQYNYVQLYAAFASTETDVV